MKEFIKKCTHFFAAAGFLSFFINTLYLTFSLYMLAVYDRVLAENRMSTLWITTVLALVALVSLGLLEFIRSRILVKASVRMDELLSRKVLKSMLSELSKSDSKGYNQGLRDIHVLRNYLSGNSIFAFFDAPWIFIYLWIIYLVHPILGLTATAGGVVIFLIGLTQSLITKKEIADQNESKKKANIFFQKSLKSSHMIQSMGMIKNAFDYFRRYNNSDVENHHKLSFKNHILGSVSVSFRSMMQVIIFGVGAALVITHQAQAGVIIAASIIMGRALAPIDQAINAWKQTSSAVDAFKNLDGLLNNYNPGKKVEIDELRGDIEVLGAGLVAGDKKILSDITFSLKQGELLGLSGHNGAGKTCLCRMLLGMWKPTKGKVTINNLEIADINQDILGKFIGYLPQAVELFPGTVGENIARLGEPDSAEILKAARLSGAHELILRFPQGYNTDIGENGLSLSGGQRQRVGLARAFYKSPGFIILDEPNSNLDIEGEKALVDALKNIKALNSTAVMITHKPELLYHADKILILENGKVKLFGPRDEVFRTITGHDNKNLDKRPDSVKSENSSAGNEFGGI
ncbi:MAG: type I secretion system permease/ATPase [Desulforegulaceae bacterium]|nr:type I secretion system permease/ATPase [Desulforegulaceae bacterium]